MSVRGARFAGTAGLASSDGRLAKGGVALPAARRGLEGSLGEDPVQLAPAAVHAEAVRPPHLASDHPLAGAATPPFIFTMLYTANSRSRTRSPSSAEERC